VFLHRTGDGSMTPKVLDFGISKVLVADSTGRNVTGMTRTGAVLGSPLYMSPEQAAGDKSIDARSDVHSLGVMPWECLVGRPPFLAQTYGLRLVEIIQGERPKLTALLPGPHGVDFPDRSRWNQSWPSSCFPLVMPRVFGLARLVLCLGLLVLGGCVAETGDHYDHDESHGRAVDDAWGRAAHGAVKWGR
jgi:serine/threonine protein kinase